MASLQVGINPVVWTNDDLPTLGDEFPLEQCLSEAHQAGYSGIELGHKFPRDPRVLRDILAEHKLSLISGWYGGRLLERGLESELNAVQAQVELLSSLGSDVLIYAEISGCVHGVRGRSLEARRKLEPDDFRMLSEQLTLFARTIYDGTGLRLAYHHHMGTVIQTIGELEQLVSLTGEEVGITLDTGHIAFAGGDPVSVVRRWGPRIRHVHLKDVRQSVLSIVRREQKSYLDAIVEGVFTVPGDGDLHFEPILQALADLPYRGWLVVEADQDPAFAQPLLFAQKGYQYVQQLALQAGLSIIC